MNSEQTKRESDLVEARNNLSKFVEEVLKPAEDRQSELKSKICELENRIVFGDRIKWEETCRRGCCYEGGGTGTVIDIFMDRHGNNVYHVKDDSNNTTIVSKSITTDIKVVQ